MNTSVRALSSMLVAGILFQTQLAGAGACDLPTFSGGHLSGTAYGAQFVLPADLNNDGFIDLVVLNSGNGSTFGSISILLNNGDGTFQPAITTPEKIGDPSWAGVADFNGDGNPDLVVYISSGSLVMLGNGDGTFKAAPAVGFHVVAVGDYNGDGKPDLVIESNPAGIMLGKGDGTFQAPINSAGNSSDFPYSGAVAADFNGDGKLDVAIPNLLGGVWVLLGDGTGKLAAPTSFGTNKWSAFPNQLAVADLTGDHKLDIVALDTQGDTITVMLGNGNGTFQVQPNFKLNTGTVMSADAVVVADLNGDGIPDVAIPHETGTFPLTNAGTISVFTGNGDGTFQPSVDYNPTGQQNQSLAAADFNGDGIPDLVFASPGPQYAPTQVGVIFGTASGGFSAPALYSPAPANAFGAPQLGPPVLADFNGDGIPDLAVLMNPVGANPLANGNNLLVALGNGDGTFQPPTGYPTANGALYVAVGDFNNDGKPDLVVSNGFAQTVLVFLGNGDGTFQASKATTSGIVSSPVVGDFNGDGKLDVIVRGSLLLGNGDGTFRASFANVTASATADLNGDGKLDLVDFVSQGNKSVSVQLGNGDGTFQPVVTYTVGGSPKMVAIGDLNGDGIPDLVAPALDGTIAVLLGNGDGTFQTAVHYGGPVGNAANWVALADFNGDGHLDMAVASDGDNLSSAVAVILGNGDGTFRDAVYYGTLGSAYLVVADVNGDHQPDLVIGAEKVVTLLNTYVPGGGNSACTPFAPLANWMPGTFQFPGT